MTRYVIFLVCSIFFAGILPSVTAAETLRLDLSFQTSAGKKIEIGHHHSWTDDCGANPFSIKLLTKVSGGTLTMIDSPAQIPMEKTDDMVGDGPGDCGGKFVPGKKVFFTPDAGYRGISKFRYQIKFKGGNTIVRTVVVEVQ